MAKSKMRARWQLAASALALSIGASLGLASPASALVPNDTVGAGGGVDVDNEWAGVSQMWNRRLNANGSVSNFVCTAQLINPRTVVLAQHCTAGVTDERYTPGEGSHMGFSFNPLNSLTGFDLWRRNYVPGGPIQNPFTGTWRSNAAIGFYNALQVNSVFNVTEPFPGGDIMTATLDIPAIGLPTYGMLFSPLSGPTHAAVVGHGATGDGTNGPFLGLDFKRRAGENMIDGLFSQNDYVAGVFNVPGAAFTDLNNNPTVESAQLLYHIDMDRENRNANDCVRGEFFGTGNGNDIVCNTGPFGGFQPVTWDGNQAILTGDHIDWFPGDALPNEASTAGGDSGSALFADQIYERPLITGVLSGGWVTGFFDPAGGYGSESYYNPLFLFRDWLVANNPYVYAESRGGNGNWSDPRHWEQTMDPNYFYIDQHGRVQNGLPRAGEPGYFADAPKWGTVFDQEIPTDVEGGTGPDALTPQAAVAPAGGLHQVDFVGQYRDAADETEGPALGEQGRGDRGVTAGVGSPTGPGSRLFVPNNSFGAFGTWDGDEDGIARFFDITLDRGGTTRVDMNVEIDKLSITGNGARLDVLAGRQLNTLIALEQHRGAANVDGALNAREYMLWGGFLTGRGAITTQTLFNVNGVLSAGGLDSVGTMTINGDYVQTTFGDMVVNVRRQGGVITNDFLMVNGGASLAGDVYVAPVNSQSRARFGDIYTVLHGTTVVGNFDDVELIGAGHSLFAESVVRAGGNVDVVVQARRLGHHFAGTTFQSLGQALDTLRWGGNFTNFQGLFDVVDSASLPAFDGMMFRLTPANAFETVPLAVRYSQGFTQGLDMRTAELRAGVRGLSDQSVARGMSIFGAGAAGADGFTPGAGRAPTNERLGFFITGQGNFTSVGDEAYEGDRYNPTHMTAFSTSDMTAGVDYRVNEHMAVGVATTLSRYLTRDTETGVTPMDHTGYGAMLYGTAWDDAWNLDAYVGVARHEYEMARVPGQDWRNDIDAAPGAVQSLAGVRAGYSFEPISGLRIGPTVGLAYSSLELDGYREFGAEDFALEVAGRTVDSLTAETALQFNYMPVNEAGRAPFAAYGRVGYVTELGDDVDFVSAHFIGAPDVGFGVSQMLDREWIAASAGFSYKMNENFQAFLEASSDTGRGELSNTAVQAGFTFDF